MGQDNSNVRTGSLTSLSETPSRPPPPRLDSSMRLESGANPEYQSRRSAWRAAQWLTQRQNPVLRTAYRPPLPPGVQQLLDQGINLTLDPSTYPAGSTLADVQNLPGIVRAFSRMLGPNLFQELNIDAPTLDPFFWNDIFGFNLVVTKTDSVLCLGNDGAYQDGGFMSIVDCAGEEDVFHEIGHAVMESGILKQRAPLYFHYSTGGAVPVGGQPPVIDAIEWLQTWFGQQPGIGTDLDGVPIGYVSEYPLSYSEIKFIRREDFAETFKWYVYYPSALWQKVDRQMAQGSSILSQKAGLIAALYAGFWFNDNGVPGGWPGYSL